MMNARFLCRLASVRRWGLTLMRTFGLLSLLLALACAGTPPAAGPVTANVDQDVRGIYALDWSDSFTIRLNVGGAEQVATTDGEEIVTFNAPDGSPLELDLTAWCADPAITCPSEAWPLHVAIDEVDPAVVQDLHTLSAVDADAPGAAVQGLVDHRTDQLLFGLDGDSGGTGDCGALALSLAGGTFYYPPETDDTAATDTAAVGIDGVAAAPGGPTGIVDGGVAVGWLGVCAWDGLVVAATLSVETTYTGTRVSDL